MSYLVLPSGLPNFSKAVISFWFRVPQKSVNAAATVWTGEPGKLLDGIIPLVVMGERGTRTPITSENEQVLSFVASGYLPGPAPNHTIDTEIIGLCPEHGGGSFRVALTHTYSGGSFIYDEQEAYTDVPTFVPQEPISTDMTYIGVDNEGYLRVNFQTKKKPTGSNCGHQEVISLGPEQPNLGGQFSYIEGTVVYTGCTVAGSLIPFFDVVVEDNTETMYNPAGTSTGEAKRAYTDISDMVLDETGVIYSDQIEVIPDQWHHVLISVELKTIETHGDPVDYSDPLSQYVDSAAKIWVAFDDENYTGEDLSTRWTEGDPNEVITDGAYEVAGTPPLKKQFGVPTYRLESPSILCHDHPLGIPGTLQTVENIYNVEMAELQIFTGISIDTSDEEKRRAFVDAEGKPVPPSQAEKTLGQRPQVLLHGTSNWKNGKNIGSLGTNNQGDPIPAGQFKRTGVIDSYKPDPSLHGPQSPVPAAGPIQLTRRRRNRAPAEA